MEPNRFKASFLKEPLKVTGALVKQTVNHSLQFVGDIIRGTHTSADSLEEDITPEGVNPHKPGGRPREQEPATTPEMEAEIRRRKDILSKLHNEKSLKGSSKER